MYLTEGINIIVIINMMAMTIRTITTSMIRIVNISVMAKLDSMCVCNMGSSSARLRLLLCRPFHPSLEGLSPWSALAGLCQLPCSIMQSAVPDLLHSERQQQAHKQHQQQQHTAIYATCGHEPVLNRC